MAFYDNLNNIKSFVLQFAAIICVNILAFIYDGNYIPMAIGLDALVLGFDLKSALSKNETKAVSV